MSKTGIVILNYNDAVTTKHLVGIIIGYESLNHIVVVDNCSTDDSYEELQSLRSSQVDVVKSNKNGGYAYGNNYGFKYIINNYKVDILFVANPDVEFEEDIILDIIRFFDKTDYAMLSGVMYEANGKVSATPAWKVPSYIDDLLGCSLLLSKINKKRTKIPIGYDKPVVRVEALPGAFFAIRSFALEDIGLLDEGTFLYCEERILAKKLLDKGYKVGLLTKSKYFHLHGSSIGKIYNEVKSKRLIFASRLYYQKKYNKINIIQECILKFCMQISLIEFRFYLAIRKLLNNFNNSSFY